MNLFILEIFDIIKSSVTRGHGTDLGRSLYDPAHIFQPCVHLCNTPLENGEVGRVMHIFHELATFRDTAEYGPSANVSAHPSPAARKATLFFTTSQSRLAERSGMKIERRSR